MSPSSFSIYLPEKVKRDENGNSHAWSTSEGKGTDIHSHTNSLKYICLSMIPQKFLFFLIK